MRAAQWTSVTLRGILAVLIGTALTISVPASAGAAAWHIVDCNVPAVANYASIDPDHAANRMNTGGSGACEGNVELIVVKCFIEHRHFVVVWHDHHSTDRSTSGTLTSRVVLGLGGRFAGENGANYRTQCDMAATHGTTSKWTKRSSAITL
jgi:hypothetical protein